MKTENRDLKLGFVSHALQGMKMGFSGKMQRIKL